MIKILVNDNNNNVIQEFLEINLIKSKDIICPEICKI